ncbi:MAG: nucleoside deaminase [Bdellovibrionales bacterium]|nr:nucleoside deaminase [Bdellovibrionales bacterium]
MVRVLVTKSGGKGFHVKGSFAIEYPRWVESRLDFSERFTTDDERMALVMRLATQQAIAHTGGPFTAAVFDGDRLVSVGMNLVEVTKNPMLHGPIVALMKAHEVSGLMDLGADRRSQYALYTGCQPCGMCTAAILLSGIPRLVYGASEKDVEAILDMERASPDLGLLREAGVEIVGNVLAAEGVRALQAYEHGCGANYNPRRRSKRR